MVNDSETRAPGQLVWSVVIPVHNCAGYLAEALPEVVAQLGDRDDAEIVVIDDCSSDDPEDVVRRLGGGRVRYLANEQQRGAIGTFNRAVEVSRGELVHLLHGDDLVLPGFYRTMQAALDGSPAVAAMCRTLDIDAEGRPLHESRRYRVGTGVWTGAFDAMATSNRVRAPAIVVRRSTYDRIGLFRTDLPHAADWEFWSRVTAAGPLVFVDEILTKYRRHAGSDTASRVRTGANVQERVTALGLITESVPVARRRKVIRRGLAYAAVFAARSALKLGRQRQWRIAAVQLREALRCVARIPGALGAPAA